MRGASLRPNPTTARWAAVATQGQGARHCHGSELQGHLQPCGSRRAPGKPVMTAGISGHVDPPGFSRFSLERISDENDVGQSIRPRPSLRQSLLSAERCPRPRPRSRQGPSEDKEHIHRSTEPRCVVASRGRPRTRPCRNAA